MSESGDAQSDAGPHQTVQPTQIGWIKLLQENKIDSGDYLEIRYRTSYAPETGMLIEEVLVRDPKEPERVRSYTPEEWKTVEFPLMLDNPAN